MSGLLQELDRWKRKWVAAKLEKATLPATLRETADSVEAAAYPNVATVLRLMLVLPVTTATVERANSALKPNFEAQ